MFTNLCLVKYAENMLDYGSPYWYGTFGNVASEALYLEKKRQYKEQYEKWSKYSFESQYGMKVHDCVGLIKGYLMSTSIDENGYVTSPLLPSKYNAVYDFSANGLEAKATEKGDISSIPEIKGLIVWKSGHVGIYVGNGWVIEERGHTYGTVKTRLADRPWAKWLKCPYIKYIDEPKPEPEKKACMVELPILREGMSDTNGSVTSWQGLMKLYNYRDDDGNEIKIDGKFGPRCAQGTKKVQKKHGLPQTGIVDAATWRAIIV